MTSVRIETGEDRAAIRQVQLELVPGSLDGVRGKALYDPALTG